MPGTGLVETVGGVLGALSGSIGALSFTAGSFSINPSGVTPGSYGDATHIPQFTVGADGRLTAAGQVAISIPSGFTPGADLLGNSTSTSTAQYVSSISFSASAAGGAVAVNGTSTSLNWTSNAITLAQAGTTKIEIKGATTDFIALGASPAASGLIRAANNASVISVRNAANTQDIGVLGVNGGNQLQIGDGSANVPSIALLAQSGGGAVRFCDGNVGYAQWLLNANVVELELFSAPLGLLVTQDSTTGATGADLTFAPQSSTATNGTPGNFTIKLGTPTGSGGDASFRIFRGTQAEPCCQIAEIFGGVETALWLSPGSAAPATNNWVFMGDGTNVTFNAPSIGGAVKFEIGDAQFAMQCTINGTQIGSGAVAFAGGVGVVGISNATTAPTSTPSGGGVLYCTGAHADLHWKDANGVDTQITPASAPAATRGYYGDGNDGAAVFDGTATPAGTTKFSSTLYIVDRDVFYTSITVNAGVTVRTVGFRVFCTGTCTISGILDNSGSSGNSGVGTSGAPGAAGGTTNNLAGGASGGASGTSGAPGVTGGSCINASWGGGGGGGGSGDSESLGGGSGGVVSAGDIGSSLYVPMSISGIIPQSAGGSLATWNYIQGGAGGGGGGGSGGAGGGGGGVIVLATAALAGSGTIQCAGGGGGNGTFSNSGGGGGGGGGVVMVTTSSSTSWTGTLNVSGGTGGPGTGTGTSGAAGSAGFARILQG